MRRLLQGVGGLIRACRDRLGQADILLDLHIYGGLLVAAAGGWHIHRAWTGVSLGLALMLIGFLGSRPRGLR